ncbi:hypothetical protein L6164_022673 [Bauhinia variegata]|uniref:Uncharacterized protein n=1 Tax=Bauhinia variegata TaxID=167791 RepID=A0ACB9MHT7_BAUVA|nr:hypothetical protein L6164_022673 [Bauhinia variegata]
MKTAEEPIGITTGIAFSLTVLVLSQIFSTRGRETVSDRHRLKAQLSELERLIVADDRRENDLYTAYVNAKSRWENFRAQRAVKLAEKKALVERMGRKFGLGPCYH